MRRGGREGRWCLGAGSLSALPPTALSSFVGSVRCSNAGDYVWLDVILQSLLTTGGTSVPGALGRSEGLPCHPSTGCSSRGHKGSTA